MPTNYSGNPGNVTTPLTAVISSCTSGSGGIVLVGTSGAHNFATYDYVNITGVTGTTEANGLHQIQVIDSTSFLLDGVTFVHAYSTGGAATDVSLTPYFQQPSDGEPGTVAGIEASIQCIADRTQYLERRLSDPAVGTSTLRTVAHKADMAALTGVVDKTYCYTTSAGLYQWQFGSTATIDTVSVIADNANTGRWIAAWQPTANTSFGVSQLDAGAKVPISLMHAEGTAGTLVLMDGFGLVPRANLNGRLMVAAHSYTVNSSQSPGDTAWHTLSDTDLAITDGVSVGDVVCVTYTGETTGAEIKMTVGGLVTVDRIYGAVAFTLVGTNTFTDTHVKVEVKGSGSLTTGLDLMFWVFR